MELLLRDTFLKYILINLNSHIRQMVTALASWLVPLDSREGKVYLVTEVRWFGVEDTKATVGQLQGSWFNLRCNRQELFLNIVIPSILDCWSSYLSIFCISWFLFYLVIIAVDLISLAISFSDYFSYYTAQELSKYTVLAKWLICLNSFLVTLNVFKTEVRLKNLIVTSGGQLSSSLQLCLSSPSCPPSSTFFALMKLRSAVSDCCDPWT